MPEQPVRRRPVDGCGRAIGFLPLFLRCSQFGFAPMTFVLGLCETAFQVSKPFKLRRRWRWNDWRRVAIFHRFAALGDVVEKRKDLVELLLLDRVVFVIVAAS